MPEFKNRCTKEDVSGENLASIRKFGLEIKNRCTLEGLNGEKLASIPKSEPEIKNRCTKERVNGENPASIPKFGPEIKNRCTKQPIFSTHPQTSPPSSSPSTRSSTRLALDVLHGGGLERARAGLTVAAKAGADAPGGGISLCFCRRGCAAPAQKPPRSTTLTAAPPKSRHAQRPSPQQPPR